MTVADIPLKEKNAILGYKNILSSRFPNYIKKIILFGSYAKGKFNRNSDIDLLILVNKRKRKIWKEIVGLSFDTLLEHNVDISPLVMEEERYAGWSPLLERIKREGVEV